MGGPGADGAVQEPTSQHLPGQPRAGDQPQPWGQEQHPAVPKEAAAEGEQSIAEVSLLSQSGLEQESVFHWELHC